MGKLEKIFTEGQLIENDLEDLIFEKISGVNGISETALSEFLKEMVEKQNEIIDRLNEGVGESPPNWKAPIDFKKLVGVEGKRIIN